MCSSVNFTLFYFLLQQTNSGKLDCNSTCPPLNAPVTANCRSEPLTGLVWQLTVYPVIDVTDVIVFVFYITRLWSNTDGRLTFNNLASYI